MVSETHLLTTFGSRVFLGGTCIPPKHPKYIASLVDLESEDAWGTPSVYSLLRSKFG